MRTFAVVATFLIAVLLAFPLNQASSPVVEVPKLSTALDDFGARPGTFHFVTNEQAMSDATELKQALTALDNLDSAVAALDKAARDRISPDLQVVRQFAVSVHQRRTNSAGTSAAEVEQRLNEAKGKFMCGACHGHGAMHKMMHGSGMGGMFGKK